MYRHLRRLNISWDVNHHNNSNINALDRFEEWDRVTILGWDVPASLLRDCQALWHLRVGGHAQVVLGGAVMIELLFFWCGIVITMIMMMMMTSDHLLYKTLLFGHFLALLFLHIVTFFLGNLRVLISVITLISLIMLTFVMAVLVFGGRKKLLKERMSETHFYALLSMVAGAVIGRRSEKNTSSKRRHKYVLCRFLYNRFR